MADAWHDRYAGLAETTLQGGGAFLVALAVALGVAQSIASVALEQLAFRRYTRLRDIALLLGLAVLENIGYRQMTVYWRIRGLVSYFRKTQSWGVMTRTGFQTS